MNSLPRCLINENVNRYLQSYLFEQTPPLHPYPQCKRNFTNYDMCVKSASCILRTFGVKQSFVLSAKPLGEEGAKNSDSMQ